jgi:pimeloyl-ACP methyl ester carboxylesterase
VRSITLPGDGLTLHGYEWGPAGSPEPPLVLLHDIAGSARSWNDVASGVAAELGHDRGVIALDARGHGSSGWSPEEAYAPDHHFADLAIALDALGVQRCTLAGFSMGGAVATIYAAALSERTHRLVIVDAYPDPEMSPGSRRIAGIIAAMYGERRGTGFDPAIARRLRDDLAAADTRRLDLWPFWEAVKAPVLIVRGEQSDVLTASEAEHMLSRTERASLVTIPGVGHQIPALRPRELAQAIAGFA